MRRRTRWIAAICALLVVGGVVLYLNVGWRSHTLYGVRCALSLRVTDARTGAPVRGAEVFAGEAYHVHDPAWRETCRQRALGNRQERACPLGYARTDAEGFVVVEASSRNCVASSGWTELTGTSRGWLDGWSGLSFWVGAPAYLPHVADRVASPRRELPRADGVPGTVVLLEPGTVALEPEGP